MLFNLGQVLWMVGDGAKVPCIIAANAVVLMTSPMPNSFVIEHADWSLDPCMAIS